MVKDNMHAEFSAGMADFATNRLWIKKKQKKQ